MPKPEEYISFADICDAVADEIADPERAASWRADAEDWRTAARMLEANDNEWGERPKPDPQG